MYNDANSSVPFFSGHLFAIHGINEGRAALLQCEMCGFQTKVRNQFTVCVAGRSKSGLSTVPFYILILDLRLKLAGCNGVCGYQSQA